MAVGSFRSCTVWFYPAQFQSESKFLWCFVCFQVKTAVCFQVLVSVTFCTFPSQNCCDILYVSKAKCSRFPSPNCCDVLYVSKAKLLWCFVRFQVNIAVMCHSFRVAYNQCSRSAQKQRIVPYSWHCEALKAHLEMRHSHTSVFVCACMCLCVLACVCVCVCACIRECICVSILGRGPMFDDKFVYKTIWVWSVHD